MEYSAGGVCDCLFDVVRRLVQSTREGCRKGSGVTYRQNKEAGEAWEIRGWEAHGISFIVKIDTGERDHGIETRGSSSQR